MNRIFDTLALQFARRYFRAKKSTNAINIISYVSIGGIAIGTAALIIILSVFNGFESLVISLYKEFTPDIVIAAKEGKSFIPNDELIKFLSDNKSVKAYTPVIEENVLLKYGNRQAIASLRGINPRASEVNGLEESIYHGDYILTDKNNNPYIYMGIGIEQSLGVNYDDPFGFLSIYVPKKGNNAVIVPEDAFNIRQVKPSGSFAIQQDFDEKYAFVSIDLMRTLTGYTNQVNSIEVALVNSNESKNFIEGLKKKWGNDLKIASRYQQNEVLYKVMQSERWAVYAILTFILIIAGFNIIGAISMLVIEKRKDISVLKVLGASNVFVRRVFLYQGILLSLLGFGIGAALAFLICLAQQLFGFIKLEGGSFVIDAYPVEMKFFDFVLVFITVFAIGFLAAWLPSVRSDNKELKLT